jgi:hypothetical protein
MAWIESHQEIGRHPKTRYAARLAGINVAQTVGHLHLIWHWALDFADDGDISGYGKWQIEDAALWDGAEGVLFDALMQAGFLEIEDNGVITKIHDWHEYAGKLIDRRRADAARKRGDSAKNPPEPPKTSTSTPNDSTGTPTDVQRNSDGGRKDSNVTVPYRTLTVPNQDQRETTGVNGAAAADAAPKTPRGSRFSSDAELTQEWIDAAVTLTFTEEQAFTEFEEFRDYWCAVAGSKGVKLDWLATWRNHLRRHLEQRGGLTSIKGGSRGTYRGKYIGLTNEQLDEMIARESS